MKQYSGFTVHIQPEIEGYELIVIEVIKEEDFTRLSIIPVVNDVEYDPEEVIYKNDFFFNDPLYLFEMIKEQIEHQHRRNEVLSVTDMFTSLSEEELRHLL